MLKSPKHSPSGDIYPISSDVFQAFISQNGFTAKEFNADHSEVAYKKDDVILMIPFKEKLTKEQVNSILNDADIPQNDFEEYLENMRISNTFNMLVDASFIKSPPKN